jgi:hypothetical protein
MSDIRLGDISFVTTADSHGAFWRGVADSEATLLCSIKASVIGDPEVSSKFRELAAAVAGHLARGLTVGGAPSARWYDTLPCTTCEHPQAADVRHLCGQATELAELQLSPSGLPVGCCRIRAVGAMSIPDIAPTPPRPSRARRWF